MKAINRNLFEDMLVRGGLAAISVGIIVADTCSKNLSNVKNPTNQQLKADPEAGQVMQISDETCQQLEKMINAICKEEGEK